MYSPFQWARQTVGGRQIETDGSRLINFYAVRPANEQESKVPVIIYGSPGYRRFAEVPPETFTRNTVPITPDPGIHGLIETNTAADGQHLIGISSEYQLFDIEIGPLSQDMAPDYNPFEPPAALFQLATPRIHNYTTEDSEKATGPLRMATDGRYVMFVSRRVVHCYDVRNARFVPVVAPLPDNINANLPDEEWVDVVWSDGYFILLARSGQFYHSNQGQITFDQLDYSTAETSPDPSVGMKVLGRQLFIFGTDSIEVWYNAGSPVATPTFAYQRNNGLSRDYGCANIDTLQATKEQILFVTPENAVWSITPTGNMRHESTDWVEELIKQSDSERARAFVYYEEGHWFYVLILTNPDDTRHGVALDLATGLWHERTQTDVLCCQRFRNRNLIGREGSPYLAALDLNFSTADGVVIERTAIAPILHLSLIHI